MEETNKEVCLITGAKGFVGKCLAQRLKNELYKDCVLTPSSTELDLRNYDKVYEFLKKYKVTKVIHLAASMSGIGELTNNPLTYLENNFLINFNIVKAALETRVKYFVTFGSSCSYSQNTNIPMREADLWKEKPENTYGISKLLLLEHLLSQCKMKFLYLVPANIYGVGDHFSSDKAHVIPATILKFENAVKEKKNKISVWGNGEQIRDFIYLEDLCNIVSELVKNNYYNSEPINISTGIGVKIKDIIVKIREYMDLEEFEIEWQVDKPIGIPKKILDNTLLMNIIKEYSFTNIDIGLKKIIKSLGKN